MKTPENIQEAKEIQLKLRQKVRIMPLENMPSLIAGVDAAFSGDRTIAAACLFTYPDLSSVEDSVSSQKTAFPYIPGYLSFREGPAVINALNGLTKKPELILFDGQGIAHPKGMGIAAHIGVLLDIPSIGCAKSRLVGSHDMPGRRKGSHTELVYRGITIGAVLRTRDNVKPLFISPGHLIDLKTSVGIVLACTGRYRIPEPLRRADALAKACKKE